jgi:signal transduction histidine kinase
MPALAAGALIAGASTFLIGLCVFIRARRDLVRQLFFFFCAGLGVWGISLGLLLITRAFVFNQFIFYAGFPIFCGLFLFVLAYPHERSLPLWSYAATAPGAIIASLAYFDVFVCGFNVDGDGSLSPINGPLMPLFSLMCAVYFLASMYLFFNHFKKSRGTDRLRMWYLLAGLLLSSGSIVLFDILLPAFGIFSLIALGPLSLVAFSGLIAYAIMRHQLMDIRIVLQRGLVYSILVMLIVGCYLMLLALASKTFGETIDTVLSIGLLTTVIGVSTAPRIERYFRRLTDHIFFKDTYDYAEALHQLSECLSSTLEVNDLTSHCEVALQNILKSERVSILPAGSSTFGAVLTLPIVLEGMVIGTISLGEKRSGDPYSREDKQLLYTFSLQAATAFGRAMLYARVSEHAQELEVRVFERTQELQAMQENQRQLMLDISHNLQTPLAVFQTKLEQLKLSSPHDEALHSLEYSLDELSVFISDFLRLARMEQQAGDAFVSLDLSALVEGLLEELEIIAADQNITITSTVTPHIHVLGDEARLREVIQSLASNSIKYMRDKGPRLIHVSLTCEDGAALLSVQDSGVGISADDVPHIFNRFWRAKQVDDVAGSGLGLSLAKHIVERHGGTISAQSELGHGTTISIRLPLA